LEKEPVEWNERAVVAIAGIELLELELGRRNRVGGVLSAARRAGRAVKRRTLGAVRESIVGGVGSLFLEGLNG
jgi:hypothetical protein